MILRLVLPSFDPAVASARLISWSAHEGSPVNFGDNLCEFAVEEMVRHRQDFHFRSFESILRGDEQALPTFAYKVSDVQYRVRLVSSEAAWLRRIAARDNEVVEVGDLLALFTTSPDDALDNGETPERDRAAFRVVPDLVQLGGVES
jgi:hypothetical protein